MIVTIDGPAGAGKSTVARRLAERLGAGFLDTGAFYRAATLAVIRSGCLKGLPERPSESRDLQEMPDPVCPEALMDSVASVVRKARIRLDSMGVWLDDEDVTTLIRTPEVTSRIYVVADNLMARRRLSGLQREYASAFPDLVTEGRDQGTEVFPEAECKIFLTASDQERARRRQAQLSRLGRELQLEQILTEQRRRDEEDRSRPVGALRVADEAVTVLTDGMSEDEVVDRLETLVLQCRSGLKNELATTPRADGFEG